MNTLDLKDFMKVNKQSNLVDELRSFDAKLDSLIKELAEAFQNNPSNVKQIADSIRKHSIQINADRLRAVCDNIVNQPIITYDAYDAVSIEYARLKAEIQFRIDFFLHNSNMKERSVMKSEASNNKMPHEQVSSYPEEIILPQPSNQVVPGEVYSFRSDSSGQQIPIKKKNKACCCLVF